jgi:hypothetical protein
MYCPENSFTPCGRKSKFDVKAQRPSVQKAQQAKSSTASEQGVFGNRPKSQKCIKATMAVPNSLASSASSSVASSGSVSDGDVVSGSEIDSYADSERRGAGPSSVGDDDTPYGLNDDTNDWRDTWLGSFFDFSWIRGKDKNGDRKFGAKESSWVRRSKLFVVLLIMGTAAGVTTGAFFIVKNSETDDFKETVRLVAFCFCLSALGAHRYEYHFNHRSLFSSPFGFSSVRAGHPLVLRSNRHHATQCRIRHAKFI